MAELFASPEMALGYARSRPPLHALILQRAAAQWNPVARALDPGCGSGLSTAPLAKYARCVTALDPNEKMLRAAVRITAAGSLNFTAFDRSFPEVRRVLTPAGRLLIYDFAQGSDFPDSDRLTLWHGEFKRRYASPPARPIPPPTLEVEPYALRLLHFDEFILGLTLTPDFHLDYAMTETNVSAAVARGTPEAKIRAWCRQTLAPVFAGAPHEVLFRGYTAAFGPI
jgi:ubiquinone/menaquinone biosynthesis C-methylase UbiE